jgi:hypothetical protein
MEKAVQFDVVAKENLPPEFTAGSGKYAPLFIAIAKLNGKEAICVSQEPQKVASNLYQKIKRDARFANIKLMQRNRKLWIFRGDK